MDAEFLKKLEKAKAESDTVILAHSYQPSEILDLADITGDSFLLAKKAASLKNKRLVVCGVRFMAETAKILSPEKEVILPSPDADCAMANQIKPERVAEFKKQNPDVAVCAYINTSSALKAECDFCVTSSSAVKIVSKIEQKDVLFIPDKNLGSYVAKQLPEKNIILWDGFCPVHDSVCASDILSVKEKYPDAVVAAHPECRSEVIALADMVGATSSIIDYINQTDKRVIVATERGVTDRFIATGFANKVIQPCCEKLTCRDMKTVSSELLLNAVLGTAGEKIELDADLMKRAGKCIENMIKLG